MSDRNSQWIDNQVARIREVARRQGHELTRLQEGMIETLAASSPTINSDTRDELASVKAAIDAEGRWAETREWRISTWFTSAISTATRDGKEVFEVSVECDGQQLSCACPTLEGAFAFMLFYETLILQQFYSVGPPWAANGNFGSNSPR
jgi:hypothetical protein